MNVSERNVARVHKVKEEAPDLAEKIRTGEMTTGKAEKEVKKRERERAFCQTADTTGQKLRLPNGRLMLAKLPNGRLAEKKQRE